MVKKARRAKQQVKKVRRAKQKASADEPLTTVSTVEVLEASSPRIVNIFISYASEDKELAGAVEDVLRKTFAIARLEFWRDAEIKAGSNRVTAIGTRWTAPMFFWSLFTERMKVKPFLDTGYEVGDLT